MTPKRHARCQAKEKSRLDVGKRERSTGWKHKTHSLPLNHSRLLSGLFLIAFFCASRLSLQNTSMLFKYNENNNKRRKRNKFESISGTWAKKNLFFFSFVACTECVTILDPMAFPRSESRCFLRACFSVEKEKQHSERCAHVMMMKRSSVLKQTKKNLLSIFFFVSEDVFGGKRTRMTGHILEAGIAQIDRNFLIGIFWFFKRLIRLDTKSEIFQKKRWATSRGRERERWDCFKRFHECISGTEIGF